MTADKQVQDLGPKRAVAEAEKSPRCTGRQGEVMVLETGSAVWLTSHVPEVVGHVFHQDYNVVNHYSGAG